MNTSLVTRSEEETSAAGEEFAARIRAGDVVLLHGDLGAGKTAFVRGLARGLGAPADEVSSPTFTIDPGVPRALTLYHVDLYRLAPVEVAELGLDEMFEGKASSRSNGRSGGSTRPRTRGWSGLRIEGNDGRRIEIERG